MVRQGWRAVTPARRPVNPISLMILSSSDPDTSGSFRLFPAECGKRRRGAIGHYPACTLKDPWGRLGEIPSCRRVGDVCALALTAIVPEQVASAGSVAGRPIPIVVERTGFQRQTAAPDA